MDKQVLFIPAFTWSAGVAGAEKPWLTPLSMAYTSTCEILDFSFRAEVSAIPVLLWLLEAVVEHYKTTVNTN